MAKTAIDQIEDPAEKLDQWRKASADYGKYFAIQTEDTDAVTEAKAEIALFGADLGNVLSKAGLVYDAQSLYGTSLAGMEEVLRGVPDRKDLRRKLVDILFGLGRYDDALAHLRFLCQIPRNRDELRKLFDRYGLDERLAAANAAPEAEPTVSLRCCDPAATRSTTTSCLSSWAMISGCFWGIQSCWRSSE